MEEPTLKNRLEVGEKIFYFDGQTQWDIETVESVNKAEKSAVLSNNAHCFLSQILRSYKCCCLLQSKILWFHY